MKRHADLNSRERIQERISVLSVVVSSSKMPVETSILANGRQLVVSLSFLHGYLFTRNQI